MSGDKPAAMSTKDWTKWVTIEPVSAISFDMVNNEPYPVAFLTLINKQEKDVIFKVKTTKPNNYQVRPNQGIISSMSNASVQVVFSFPLDSPVSYLLLSRESPNIWIH